MIKNVLDNRAGMALTAVLTMTILAFITRSLIYSPPAPQEARTSPTPTAVAAGTINGSVRVSCRECDERTVLSAYDIVIERNGTVVSQLPISPEGRFSATLPAGEYHLKTFPDTKQAADNVIIKSGVTTPVTVMLDGAE